MKIERNTVELISIRYQNVRGFYDTTLPLEAEKTLLVGRNNAGKTSALLLLAWVINDADMGCLYYQRELNSREQDLLLPARSARHKARRITLTVRMSDGRTARGYRGDENKRVTLRIGFRVSGAPTAFIRLGPAKIDSGSHSDERAWELLQHIQRVYSVVHIPSARDATSLQFRDRFLNLYKDKLTERALHPGRRSGVTVEHKKISETVQSLKELAKDLLNPMLKEMARSLPEGMLQSPSLTFKEETEQSVVDWIVDQVVLKLVTGEHDDMGVLPQDVGAGLQSVLDIAVASVILKESGKQLIVAIEEPEAFLTSVAAKDHCPYTFIRGIWAQDIDFDTQSDFGRRSTVRTYSSGYGPKDSCAGT